MEPVTCYVPTDKARARMVCEAFAEGCAKRGVAADLVFDAEPLRDGTAVFYGVRPSTKAAFDAARHRSHKGRGHFLYVDNCYLGPTGEFFRITWDDLQHDGSGDGDPRRLEIFDAEPQPWKQGETVLVCPPTDEWMAITGQPWSGREWLQRTTEAIGGATRRPVKVRWKVPRDRTRNSPLGEDLANAWCVVTYASNVAVRALIAGVPVIATGPSAARAVSGNDPAKVEEPRMDGDRARWLCVLAANQWSLSEIRSGVAWKALSATIRT